MVKGKENALFKNQKYKIQKRKRKNIINKNRKKKKNPKKKIQKNQSKKKKEFVFNSPGQNVRLLSLPYSWFSAMRKEGQL